MEFPAYHKDVKAIYLTIVNRESEQNYVEQTSRGLPTIKRSRKKGAGPSKTHSLHPLWDVGLLFGVIHSEWFWLPSQKMLFGFHIQGVLALHIIFLSRANVFYSLEISKQVFKKPRKKKNVSESFLRSVKAYFPGHAYAINWE